MNDDVKIIKNRISNLPTIKGKLSALNNLLNLKKSKVERLNAELAVTIAEIAEMEQLVHNLSTNEVNDD
ncbi:MAG: hypothetical protein SVV88_08765 [Pseudomonadota bacterium]|nr:hypothetical protein [Pseudomonadota bacterium]